MICNQASGRIHITAIEEYPRHDETHKKRRKLYHIDLENREPFSFDEVRDNWNENMEVRLLELLMDESALETFVRERIWALTEFIVKHNWYYESIMCYATCYLNTWKLEKPPLPSIANSIFNIIETRKNDGANYTEWEYVLNIEVLKRSEVHYPERTMELWIHLLKYKCRDRCITCRLNVDVLWKIQEYLSKWNRDVLLEYPAVIDILQNALKYSPENFEDFKFVPDLLLIKRLCQSDANFYVFSLDIDYHLQYQLAMSRRSGCCAVVFQHKKLIFSTPKVNYKDMLQIHFERIGTHSCQVPWIYYSSSEPVQSIFNNTLCDIVDHFSVDHRINNLRNIYQLPI